jgi:hypothetical protein
MGHYRLAVALILLAVLAAGCVDLLSDREVLHEASWYGRATGAGGAGIANATVVLHVLGPSGEIYSREAVTASSEPVRGIYAFEHIELRDGADRAYTTCTVDDNDETLSATGDVRPLDVVSRTSTMSVSGKNITVVTYDGVVDEHLIVK